MRSKSSWDFEKKSSSKQGDVILKKTRSTGIGKNTHKIKKSESRLHEQEKTTRPAHVLNSE